MFHILAAMAAIYGFKDIQEKEEPEELFYKASFLCGIGIVFYGLFVVSITITGLGYIWHERHSLSHRKKNRRCGWFSDLLMRFFYSFFPTAFGTRSSFTGRVLSMTTTQDLSNRGKLAGTLNETGLNPTGWYWSSSQNSGTHAWVQCFSDGNQGIDYKVNRSSLRCVP